MNNTGMFIIASAGKLVCHFGEGKMSSTNCKQRKVLQKQRKL